MTRYQINIGDEFPVESDAGGQRAWRPGRFRHPPHGPIGALVRGLFCLALAAMAVTHPVPAVIGLGAVLLIGRYKGTCGGFARWHRAHHGHYGHDDWHGGFQRGRYGDGAFV